MVHTVKKSALVREIIQQWRICAFQLHYRHFRTPIYIGRTGKCQRTGTLTVEEETVSGSLNRLQAGTEVTKKKRSYRKLNPTYLLAHTSVAVPNTTVV